MTFALRVEKFRSRLDVDLVYPGEFHVGRESEEQMEARDGLYKMLAEGRWLYINDMDVSRHHGTFHVSEDGITYTDLGSRNGTTIGDPFSDPVVPNDPVRFNEGNVMYVARKIRITLVKK